MYQVLKYSTERISWILKYDLSHGNNYRLLNHVQLAQDMFVVYIVFPKYSLFK